ncbi:MAG: type II toxin-antitoxin system VapC family toxin [Devosia sp.]
MIVVDTSVLIAMFAKEPDAPIFKSCIAADEDPVISAASLLETSIVLRTLGGRRSSDQELDGFVAENLRVVPVDHEQVQIARDAHLKYGKGMGHPAQLNFGDCFSYALAKVLDVPLLYKGGDFSKTDIKSAL